MTNNKNYDIIKEKKENTIMAHLDEMTEQLKNNIKKQLDEAYKEGVKQGAIITAATIYKVMKLTNLEETNIFFQILCDIAKRNGCDDLASYVKALGDNKEE